MAQQISCDSCEQAQAVMLVTNLTNGDVIGLCPSCLPEWGRAIGATVEAELAHDEQGHNTGATPEQVEPMVDGVSPNHPATYPAADDDPDTDPHAPATTGPSSPSEVPVPTDPGIDPEHPHAPAITGPGTYEEEGGAAAPPAPANPGAPAELPPTADPADAPAVEQVVPDPAFV